MVPIKDTTTEDDIFSSLTGALDKVVMDRSRAVSLATDDAPSMVGRKAGVATKFHDKVQTANGRQAFWLFHCILHQEALCSKTLKMRNRNECRCENCQIHQSARFKSSTV